MIERLLAAERALAGAQLETADRLFRQVADADPRNAIAVVGLARVAEARGERGTARALVERALEIDPEEALARRLRETLEEQAGRERPEGGESPEGPESLEGPDSPEATIAAVVPSPGAGATAIEAAPHRRGGLIDWLRRLLGRERRAP